MSFHIQQNVQNKILQKLNQRDWKALRARPLIVDEHPGTCPLFPSKPRSLGPNLTEKSINKCKGEVNLLAFGRRAHQRRPGSTFECAPAASCAPSRSA
jgi:hypothetical protein